MGSMPTQTANLFLLEELGDRAPGQLGENDLEALRALSEWITSYVASPHEDLVGHPGTVCPFVPGSLERKTLWLAPERIAGRDAADVVELMGSYKARLLEAEPTAGDGVIYKVICVVFTDLETASAKAVFDAVISELAVSSYVEDGVLFGPYYEGNEVTAFHNPSFRPFESPVPFMFVRFGVVGDWEFFPDDEEWLRLWARRYGESAVLALAEQLRRLPWRTATHSNEGRET